MLTNDVPPVRPSRKLSDLFKLCCSTITRFLLIQQKHQKRGVFRLQLFMLSSGEKYLRHTRAPCYTCISVYGRSMLNTVLTLWRSIMWMWDLIVSVPDHCLSFYLLYLFIIIVVVAVVVVSPVEIDLHLFLYKFDFKWLLRVIIIIIRRRRRRRYILHLLYIWHPSLYHFCDSMCYNMHL